MMFGQPAPRRRLMGAPDAFGQSSLAKLGGMMQQQAPQPAAPRYKTPDEIGAFALGTGSVAADGGSGGLLGRAGVSLPGLGSSSPGGLGSGAASRGGGAGGGLLGMAGVSLPGVNAPAQPAAAGGFNALTDWQGQIDSQRGTIDAIHNRANPFADPHAMDIQKRGLESQGASQMAHAARDARNMAFAGPMVAQQDLDNLNSTGRAALLSGLAGVDLQRKQAADNWGRQNYQDEQAARTQYGQMLGDLYGLTDANRRAYEAADTYGIRRAGLDAQTQAGQANLRQQQNENDMAPLRRAETEQRIAQLQQAMATAQQQGDATAVASIGRMIADLAPVAGSIVGGPVGGFVGAGLGSIINRFTEPGGKSGSGKAGR